MLQFTDIGKEYTEGNEDKILKEVDSLDWLDLPIKNAPMSQGMAIQGVIEEWKIPAKKAALYGMLANFGLYGVQTKKQQIFFVDLGCSICPIALRDIWKQEHTTHILNQSLRGTKESKEYLIYNV